MFETLRDDYRRHESSVLNPALWAVFTYRFGVWANQQKHTPIRWGGAKIYGVMFFLVLITSGIRLHREIKIGKGFHLVHSGNIQIHPHTVIGDNCGIQQDVTIGINMDRKGAPVIGNNVYIGKGATVLGPIRIGDGVRIAANTLVINDIPDGVTAIGVPARVIRYAGGTKTSRNA